MQKGENVINGLTKKVTYDRPTKNFWDDQGVDIATLNLQGSNFLLIIYYCQMPLQETERKDEM